MKKRIVAEITRNWKDCLPIPGEKLLVSQEFENAISVNYDRGYALESWKFTQFVYDGILTETIIAVFVDTEA